MPSHTIQVRPMTEVERRSARTAGQFTPDHWAWVLLPILASSFIGWLLGLAIRRFLAPGLLELPIFLACAAGFAAIFGSIFVYRIFARTHEEARADVNAATVEVIEVSEPVVVQQEESNDEGPIFYFDIGGGKLLFLWGQWLYDSDIFWHDGHSFAEDDGYERLEDVLEESSEPPFPNSHFVLHRTTNLGIVTRIDLRGERVTPQSVIPATAVRLSALPPSCILTGSLQDLQAAVART